MLKQLLHQIVQANPGYAALTPVIEKEILHHDVMAVLIQHGVMHRLTFVGGTALRMCYNSSRLSEDLDFNGGHHFKPTSCEGLDTEIKTYLQNKYETEVSVMAPSSTRQGDTVSWNISIVKDANRPDLPRQKVHIDVCAIPSFEIEKRPLLNHYNAVVPTEGILVPVQSLQELFVDKLIAFAYRARRIKPRDLWDIVWIKQRGVALSRALLTNKLDARQKHMDDFHQALSVQLGQLMSNSEVCRDFQMEMSRFIPQNLKENTLDHPEYWAYLQGEVHAIASELLHGTPSNHPFDMGDPGP